jgi:hypothetical protein
MGKFICNWCRNYADSDCGCFEDQYEKPICVDCYDNQMDQEYNNGTFDDIYIMNLRRTNDSNKM